MIKVCHIISSCITHHGPNNVLLPVVLNADRFQYDFAVYSLYPPPPSRSPASLLAEAGVEFQLFKMGGFLDLKILIPLVRALRHWRPDILHCHLVRANLYGRIAGRLAGIPVIINTHHGIEDYMVSDSVRDRAVRRVERLTDSLVTRHVAVSEVMRRAAIKLLDLAPARIETVYNGVDLSLYAPRRHDRAQMRRQLGVADDAILVGSVGILNTTKNFPLLIRIAKLVVEKEPRARFVIFGEGEERHVLEKLIGELDLQKYVLLAGFRSDVQCGLAALDVFALTSRSEGFGLAVAEAMAAGLPCVAFNVGALNELVNDGETGFLAPDGDVDAFYHRLMELVASPALRTTMGNASSQRCTSKFGADAMVRHYSELYDRLMLGISK
jgi:glycosyltransferase involved in cell wall biosynthesis